MAAETTFQSSDAVKCGFAQVVMPNVKAAARQRPSAMRWRRVALPVASRGDAGDCPPALRRESPALGTERARSLLSKPARGAGV